ncbi:MAG: glycosyltransferase [Bacteroidetes bacterium]|nr:glycosyltransferase [Bacteroidota bacterium]MBS1648325.1 glycosyltransferase [Bacteroidota bacterium]
MLNKLKLLVSVIIVNYNVKYFLGQCLASVQNALLGIKAEIIVVDNASTDNSCAYLKTYFPFVKLIENTTNAGFSKACNAGAAIALGEFILFLNPDTLIDEIVVKESIAFIKSQKNIGAVGVQMIDGSGKFLPESKRSFPSVISSFYKLTGLASLFSSSKKINKYGLGNFNKNEIHEVDALCGAFMLMPKYVFTMCNGFDEQFFMYGEDIDLCYRIKQLNYCNYYLGNLSIIHFKGESIHKPNIKYTKIFYGAMKVFVEKHYAKTKAIQYATIIQWLINITAIAAFIKQGVRKFFLPLLDVVIVYASLFRVKQIWVNYIKNGVEFNTYFITYAIPLYTIAFVLAAVVSGIYDNVYKPSKALLASVSATVVLLAFYSLLPENIRFSRGVVLVGSIVATILITVSRWVLLHFKIGNYQNFSLLKSVIIGTEQMAENIIALLTKFNLQEKIITTIAIKNYTKELKENITRFNINEIIFSNPELSVHEIILIMKQYAKQCCFSFYNSSTNTIINSYNKNKTGISYSVNGAFNLSMSYYKRLKRWVDIVASFMLLLTFPLQLLFIKNGFKAIKNCWQIFIGYKTFVGYHFYNNHLPFIKPSVIQCSSTKNALNKEVLVQADKQYAKDYDYLTDIKLIIFNYKQLDK